QVRATIYRSDNSVFGTTYTDVGYFSAEAWYAYGYSDESGFHVDHYSRNSSETVWVTDESGTHAVTVYGQPAPNGYIWNAVDNWNVHLDGREHDHHHGDVQFHPSHLDGCCRLLDHRLHRGSRSPDDRLHRCDSHQSRHRRGRQHRPHLSRVRGGLQRQRQSQS